MRQWRRKARRPSGQDLVMLLRQQFSQEQDPVTNPEPMILTAAAWRPCQPQPHQPSEKWPDSSRRTPVRRFARSPFGVTPEPGRVQTPAALRRRWSAFEQSRVT